MSDDQARLAEIRERASEGSPPRHFVDQSAADVLWLLDRLATLETELAAMREANETFAVLVLDLQKKESTLQRELDSHVGTLPSRERIRDAHSKLSADWFDAAKESPIRADHFAYHNSGEACYVCVLLGALTQAESQLVITRRALETTIKTTKIGGAAEIARKALEKISQREE